MHTHPIETAALTEAAQRGDGRFNFYATIHKALRAAMNETLHALGRTDPEEPAELHSACDRVVELMELMERHVEHENQFIHPALRARCPGVCGGVRGVGSFTPGSGSGRAGRAAHGCGAG